MSIQRTLPRPTNQTYTEPAGTTKTKTAAPTKITVPSGISDLADRVLVRASELLARYSIDILRISLGVVFLAFGVQKFFPGVSPAEPLVVPTIETLTFGIISGGTALLLTAIVECFIGITMLTGKFLKTGLVVLAGALVGIMSPLVLFFTDLFPGGTPTLEAQYVFKDIVLAAAGMVVAAKALGARLRAERR